MRQKTTVVFRPNHPIGSPMEPSMDVASPLQSTTYTIHAHGTCVESATLFSFSTVIVIVNVCNLLPFVNWTIKQKVTRCAGTLNWRRKRVDGDQLLCHLIGGTELSVGKDRGENFTGAGPRGAPRKMKGASLCHLT